MTSTRDQEIPLEIYGILGPFISFLSDHDRQEHYGVGPLHSPHYQQLGNMAAAWAQGGCLLLALALRDCLGPKATLWAAWETSDPHGRPTHAFIRIGHFCLDGSGIHSDREMAARWDVLEKSGQAGFLPPSWADVNRWAGMRRGRLGRPEVDDVELYRDAQQLADELRAIPDDPLRCLYAALIQAGRS